MTEIEASPSQVGAMPMITFAGDAQEALETIVARIPYGFGVALVKDGEQFPSSESDEVVPDRDVAFITCDDRGVTYAGLDADGNKDGTTGLRPWAEIGRVHVY